MPTWTIISALKTCAIFVLTWVTYSTLSTPSWPWSRAQSACRWTSSSSPLMDPLAPQCLCTRENSSNSAHPVPTPSSHSKRPGQHVLTDIIDLVFELTLPDEDFITQFLHHFNLNNCQIPVFSKFNSGPLGQLRFVIPPDYWTWAMYLLQSFICSCKPVLNLSVPLAT